MSLVEIKNKATNFVVDKASDVLISDIEKGTAERDKLLAVYNDKVKGEITRIINRHKIIGAIVGPLPTFGILTTANMIFLYTSLSKVVDVSVMDELDAILSKALASSKWSFIKLGTSLAMIKQGVSIMDETVVAAPIGIILGLFCGYKFTHSAGLSFANKMSEMVNEAMLKEDVIKH